MVGTLGEAASPQFKAVGHLAMRPATGAVDGDDVMDLGLPTPDHIDPEAAGPEIPLSLLSVWGGPLKEINKQPF